MEKKKLTPEVALASIIGSLRNSLVLAQSMAPTVGEPARQLLIIDVEAMLKKVNGWIEVAPLLAKVDVLERQKEKDHGD